MDIQRDPRITEADATIIRIKVLKLIGHYGYTRSDIDPLTEDLQTHVGEVIHKYRADRGARSTFVSRVVKNNILNRIEERKAKKRNEGQLPSPIDEVPDEALCDVRTQPASIDFGMDFEDAVTKLPEALQLIAISMLEDGEATTMSRFQLKRGVVRQRWKEVLRHPAIVKLAKSLNE